jgi:hypothetical protein
MINEIMQNMCEESIKQKVNAWDAITELLDSLSPDWLEPDGNGLDLAMAAIKAMAGERDALREELRKAREQEPIKWSWKSDSGEIYNLYDS